MEMEVNGDVEFSVMKFVDFQVGVQEAKIHNKKECFVDFNFASWGKVECSFSHFFSFLFFPFMSVEFNL